MKKLKKIIRNKNVIILLLCLTIIALSIGFALISMSLKERQKNDKIYEVEIVNIQEGTAIRGGVIQPTAQTDIINNGKTAKFTFNLSSPEDTLTYIVTVKNNGNLKAKIDGISESPDYIHDDNQANSIYPIILNHNDIKNQKLNPGEEIKLTITVQFANSGVSINKTVPYEVSILTSCVE